MLGGNAIYLRHQQHTGENEMPKTHPDIRFDAIVGGNYPFRIAQRVTRSKLEEIAARMGRRIAWGTMNMIGNTTAEVTLTK